MNIDTLQSIKSIKTPILFLVAEDDKISPPDKVKQLFVACNSSLKKFKILKGSHHDFRDWWTLDYGMRYIKKIWDIQLQKRTQSLLTIKIKAKPILNKFISRSDRNNRDNHGFGCF